MGGAWLLFGIMIWIIPLTLMLLSLAGLVWLWYRVLRMRRGNDLPSCGMCGYAVRGVGSLNCPECGIDLREAGIITPSAKGMLKPWMFLLWWTLLLPVPALVVSLFAAFLMPWHYAGSDRMSFEPDSQAYRFDLDYSYQAVSRDYIWFDLYTYSSTSSSNAPSEIEVSLPYHIANDVALELAFTLAQAPQDAGPVTLNWEQGMWEIHYHDDADQPLVVRRGDLSLIEDWFVRSGLDLNDDEIAQEAHAIHELVDGFFTSASSVRMTGFADGHSSRILFSMSMYPSPVGLILLGVFWIALYAVGIWFFFARHRRVHEQVRQALEEAAQPL